MLRLGDLLVQVGKIDNEQLESALSYQKQVRKKLGEVLIELGYVTGGDIIQALEYQLGIPHVDLKAYEIDVHAVKLISHEFAREHKLIPVSVTDDNLNVAMHDPFDIIAIREMENATGKRVEPMIAVLKDIDEAIVKYYSEKNVEKAVEEFKREFDIVEEEFDEELMTDVNNAPIVRLVDSIILQAIQSKTSDIHIEPFSNTLKIRFRKDGILYTAMEPEKHTHGAIVTRLKIMANMNIAERRVPQDGRIERFIDGKMMDLRISTLPTIYGEKVVIRIVDSELFLRSKDQLGLSGKNKDEFEELLKAKNGIILVTGPTGSGKSTTLYTVLSELNEVSKNIITIEDPVEYRMDGINQVQVNTKAGMTFASGLRSMLRQDPDVIMIGEIRDSETAQIAIRAAITGHVVLSTLHTNDSVSSIIRLTDMKIESYLVASAVKGIVAQRLVRTICPHCKEPHEPTLEEMKMMNCERMKEEPKTIYKGRGCRFCNHTGYLGRTAIYEILILDKNIRRMIAEGRSGDEIYDYARSERKMESLQDSCKKLICSGVTTIEEYMKVAYSIEG